MNIYDDQTDLVLASWARARRRESIAFWLAAGGTTAGLLGLAILYHLI